MSNITPARVTRSQSQALPTTVAPTARMAPTIHESPSSNHQVLVEDSETGLDAIGNDSAPNQSGIADIEEEVRKALINRRATQALERERSNTLQALQERIRTLEAETATLRHASEDPASKRKRSSHESVAPVYLSDSESDDLDDKTYKKTAGRYRDPPVYQGTNRAELDHWLNQLALIFKSAPRTYRTDSDRITLAAQYLNRELSTSWALEERSNPEETATWAEFVAYLQGYLGDALTVEYDLRQEYQDARQKAHQTVHLFAVELRSLEARLPVMSNEHKVSQLFTKLLPAIRVDYMAKYPYPTERATLIAQAQFIQNRLRAKGILPTDRPAPRRPFTPTSTAPPRRIAPVSNPNNIPTPPYVPRTAQEKEAIQAERRLKNLCLYCGAADHSRKDCEKANSRYGNVSVRTTYGQ